MHLATWLEMSREPGRDLHLGAAAGIARYKRGPRPCREGSEAAQLDLIPTRESGDDLVKDCVDDLLNDAWR